MHLWYHKGQNFGDLLNPYIFHNLLPDLFNENENQLFIGIGSLLGFKFPAASTKIIFSSGFAAGQPETYGHPPSLDNSFKILCVRGPHTAKILGLDPSMAITDGAALLKFVPGVSNAQAEKKKFRFSYMPHCGSEEFFDWASLCADMDLQYISPKENIDTVIKKINQSQGLITEALHGAIVADLYSVPWVPVKAYSTINDFKWQDWSASLNLKYDPVLLPAVYSKHKTIDIIRKKFGGPEIIHRAGGALFNQYQSVTKEKKVRKIVKKIMNDARFTYSDRSLLHSTSDRLLNVLMGFYEQNRKK